MTDEIVPVNTGDDGQAPVAPTDPVNTDNTPSETPRDVINPTEFTAPEEYKDKGWTKNIKSIDDLWKTNDNAQELIGRKTVGVPDKDSTPEQFEEYYSKVRPENAEAYEFPEYTTDIEKELYSKAFYDNGLTKKQSEGIIKDHSEFMEAQKAQMYSAEGFEAVMKDTFKGDTEAQASVKKLLDRHSNEADEEIVNNMSNEQAGVLYRIANNFANSHGAIEGGALNNEASSQNMSESQVKDRQSAIRQQISDLSGKAHNKADKDKLLADLAKTYKGVK